MAWMTPYVDIRSEARLDELQAKLLSLKLPYLDTWNDGRRHLAELYKKELRGLPVTLPDEAPWARHVYHLYVIRTSGRDELAARLGEQKIGTGLHYPIPLHMQNAYTDMGYRPGDFPVTEKVATEILSLPMFPQLTEAMQQTVATAIRKFK